MIIRIFDAQRRSAVQSGYGLMAKELSAHLKALGNEIKFFPDDGSGEDVVLWIRPPHYIKYPEFKEGRKNVFFTMHETETFEGWKSDWPELLNKCDLVVTPTEWNKNVFEKNGVTAPIAVVPLGVDPKMFHGDKTYEFSIMTHHNGLGSSGSRENWADTLKAYFNAFYDFHQNEVVLNIKSYEMKFEQFKETLNELQANKDPRKLPLVNVINNILIPEDLNKLYAQHWLFIKNANREGWSLPLWEAMAVGVKIAHTDLPVFSDVDPRFSREFPLGDIGKLTKIMLDEFKHWKKQKGFINSYSWKESARKLNDAIKKA